MDRRPQYVRLHDCVSELVVCSAGTPQGTVLSPFLFVWTPQTSGSTRTTAISRSSQMIRPSSDAYLMGTTRNTGGSSVTLSAGVRPTLTKTKADFRRKPPPPTTTPMSVQEKDSGLLQVPVRVHLNKKVQSRLHLLRRLRSSRVGRTLPKTVYDYVVASALFYTVVC